MLNAVDENRGSRTGVRPYMALGAQSFNRQKNGKNEEEIHRGDGVPLESLQHFDYYTEFCVQMSIDVVDCLYQMYHIIIIVFSTEVVESFGRFSTESQKRASVWVQNDFTYFGTAQRSLESAH